MCRTVHALLQTAICGIQMLVRVFMTVILMIENLIRMILQTLYNFVSFMLQMISLVPICVVFLLTARLKCFMCGGGGPCPVNRGGTCDCLMSAMAIVILFLIFRATGVLDKIFYKIGYVKARPLAFNRFVPTPGDVTECSRNDTDDGDGKSSTKKLPPPKKTKTRNSIGEDTALDADETETGTEAEAEAETETETEIIETTNTQTLRTKRNDIKATEAMEETVEGDVEETKTTVEADAPDNGEAKITTEAEAHPGTTETNVPRKAMDYFTRNNLTTVLYYLV